MKSIPAAAFAIGLFVFGALAEPLVQSSRHIRATIDSHLALVAPTTVFADDFSTNTSTSYSTSGQIGSSAWFVNRSGTDWGARRNTSPQQLELTNDASASTNQPGWIFSYTPTTSFASPYSSTLSGNSDIVTWSFNMRQILADPQNINLENTYGVAFILATNSTDPTLGSGKTGYAVVLGEDGTVDRLKLVRFSGGLHGTITPLITATTSGLSDFGSEYLSIRVTYNPSNNQWQLFVRNDGTTGFADAGSGTLTLQGSATNSTYTATSLNTMGAYWQGSNAAGQTAFFDNVSVKVGSTVSQPGTLSFESTSYSTGESDGTATITVKRNGGTDGSVSVDYGASGVSATGGGACGFGTGVDFVTPSGTLTFGDGVDTQTFNLAVCDDQLFEGTESVNLSLSNPTGGATVGTGSATVSILDNDDQPTVEFGSATSNVNEGSGSKTFVVNRTGAVENSFTVDFATADETALNGLCGSGGDYVSNGGTLNFAAGDPTKTFNVTICDDALVESSETFSASLLNATNSAVIGAVGSETVTIDDNDVSVQFASAEYAKREGSTVSIVLTRSGLMDAPATVSYSVGGGTATPGICGTAGVDFAAPSGSVAFAVGETTKSIDIEICSDTVAESPNETFVLSIESALGASIGSPASTSVSLLEPLRKSMWVFGGSLVPNPVSDVGGRSTLIGRSYNAAISELYVSVYQSTLNSNGRRMYEDSDMAALNALSHSAGQEVWAAYGNADWPELTAGCPGSSFPEARMAEVAAFNASRSANERFDGVMLDVEPSPANEAEFQSLIEHYECVRTRLPSEVKLGVAISAFWDDDVIDYPAAEASFASKPVSSHIIDLPLDRVVVMGYRDSAGTEDCPTSNGLFCLDKDEVEYASSIGKEGLVFTGLETMELPGQDNVTFNEEGQITMEAEAGLLGNFFDASSGMGGFAIHNYQSAYLGGSLGWPIGPSAALASLSGRVLSARGAGISGLNVIVQGVSGEQKIVKTNTFGYYVFPELEAGQTYIVTVSSRKYGFVSASQVVNLDDNVDGVNFAASP